jgi:tetratricopeptide (TPR) repeat protein
MIAVGNLEVLIHGQVSRTTRGQLTVGERAELVELIALRGHVLGCIADYERAGAMADALVCQVPRDARSFVARARTRGVLHRSAPALADLDTAGALGGDRVEIDAERAATYQALGRYDEALAIRLLAVDCRADFSALAAPAGVYGENGEIDEAERWFTAATRCYRGTSPFPLAMLELQRGRLWMEHDDLRRARAWCEAAIRRLPAYVPAQRHLAELEAALGETAPAIARLRPLALTSDDPITRPSSPASWATPAKPRKRRAGAARRKPATTKCSCVTKTRSPIMPPSSGSRSAAIASEPSASRARTSHSARPPRARALVRRSSDHRPGH